jgi:hypothetical protein
MHPLLNFDSAWQETASISFPKFNAAYVGAAGESPSFLGRDGQIP